MKLLLTNLAEYKYVFLFIAMTGAFIGAVPFGILWIALVCIQVSCLLLGIFLSIYKEKSYDFVYDRDYKGIKKCSRCGEELHNGYTGRGTNTTGNKFRYYHDKCDKLNYCEEIKSCPSALTKYHEIYGMSPEDKLINNR